jgi:hypothetical protein
VHAAAPHAEDQPAIADLIDGGGFFRQAQRMAQRQHLHGEADLHPPGPRGDRAGDAERRRQNRTGGIEMQLAQPHCIKAPAFGAIHQLEGLRECLRVGPSRQGRKFMEDAEFHYGRFPDLRASLG